MDRVPPYPGFPQERHYDSHFHALARSIIYQQLASAAAATIHGRVLALTPGSAFSRPEEFLELREESLRGAGLSRAKMRSILDLSSKVVSGEVRLRSISRRPDEEVLAELTSVWGIGTWTAQMFLMFRLGRLDIMPAGDLGIQEGLKRLDRLEDRPGPAAVTQRAQVWVPLRTVAAWVLWRLVDLD
jgi:3-methyladenine DNA glycosylase/8-oxoguanine DNA glycosylase